MHSLLRISDQDMMPEHQGWPHLSIKAGHSCRQEQNLFASMLAPVVASRCLLTMLTHDADSCC